jgi:hypothetical protein
MKIDKWIEILVGTIIIGVLLLLLNQVFDMKGTLGTVDSKITSTSERVERIASVLPDLRIKIAMEEVNKPIQAAVFTTEPFKNNLGNWITTVNVIDSIKGESQTYLVKLKGQDDKSVACLVRGSILEFETDAVSFLEFERFSADIGKPVYAPSYVLVDSSFVIRKSYPEYIKVLEKILGVSPKKGTFTSKITTWGKLTNEIKDNPNFYKPQ